MDLAEPYRAQAVAEIRQIAQSLDGFLVHSEYYGDFMSGLLELPRERLHKVPLGIDTSGFPDRPADRRPDRPPTIGFLARHCPAKGLHVLVDAFLALRRGPGAPAARLRSAGWLGEEDREYFEQQRSKVAAAGLADEFSYAGVVDRAGKIEFLRGLDVLAVPTTYREPKGLFVLEALAAGVPVVLPEHGAFPELIAATGGGVLVPPDDPNRLAQTLGELLADEPRRQALARAGHEAVHRRLDALAMARTTLAVLRKVLSNVRGR
jgi:glycosyltransferase involved in cell wall biosynthesis